MLPKSDSAFLEPFLRRYTLATACLAASGLLACGPANAPGSPTPEASTNPRQAVIDCVRSKGWDVIVGADGFGVSVPAEQNDRLQADIAECERQHGNHPATPKLAFSREEATWYYAEFLKVNNCLKLAGYPVSDPPSETAYVEQAIVNPLKGWHPHDALVEAGRDVGSANRDCPISRWPGK